MRLFSTKKEKPRLKRGSQFVNQRNGKKRVDSHKVRAFNKRFAKRSNKLSRSGFRKSGGKPMNQMSNTEYLKLRKKVDSGNYDLEIVMQPPKWANEPPREWAMLRRKKA